MQHGPGLGRDAADASHRVPCPREASAHALPAAICHPSKSYASRNRPRHCLKCVARLATSITSKTVRAYRPSLRSTWGGDGTPQLTVDLKSPGCALASGQTRRDVAYLSQPSSGRLRQQAFAALQGAIATSQGPRGAHQRRRHVPFGPNEAAADPQPQSVAVAVDGRRPHNLAPRKILRNPIRRRSARMQRQLRSSGATLQPGSEHSLHTTCIRALAAARCLRRPVASRSRLRAL